MARILNVEKVEIECDCGNRFYLEGTAGLACNKCGNFYEIAVHLCTEHRI